MIAAKKIIQHRKQAQEYCQNSQDSFLQKEEWLKVPLANIDLHSFKKNNDLTESHLRIQTKKGNVLIQDIFDDSSPSTVPGFAIDRYIAASEDLIEKKPDFFKWQNLALCGINNIVYVPTGEEYHCTLDHYMNENIACDRVCFFVDENASLYLEETFHFQETLQNDGPYLFNNHLHIIAGKNSNINLLINKNTNLSQNSKKLYFFSNLICEQDSNSNISIGSFSLCTGNYVGKSFCQSNVVGQGAEFHFSGVANIKDKSYEDLDVSANHYASNTNSNLIYRTIANNQAHSVFFGNLYIESSLKKVYAEQVNNNLIMNKEARAESMPNLRIHAEDVYCEHGATTGMFDETSLFYLESRGFSREQAKEILTQAFFLETLNQFPDIHSFDEKSHYIKHFIDETTQESYEKEFSLGEFLLSYLLK